MRSTITRRLEAQLNLALLGDCGCYETLTNLYRGAQALGMTGAEIDSALGGRSFEARTHAAIAFARAIKSGNPAVIDLSREKASKIGIGTDELAAIAQATRRILMEAGS
jgi:hypothetical protein